MEIIKIGKKEVDLQYTFNSFKYMQEFDINALVEAETKPFKILGILEIMLMGALNNNPKIKISEIEVQNYIETSTEDGAISDLLEILMDKLQKSTFFKMLQKTK